jgi:hypothetical protein
VIYLPEKIGQKHKNNKFRNRFLGRGKNLTKFGQILNKILADFGKGRK